MKYRQAKRLFLENGKTPSKNKIHYFLKEIRKVMRPYEKILKTFNIPKAKEITIEELKNFGAMYGIKRWNREPKRKYLRRIQRTVVESNRKVKSILD